MKRMKGERKKDIYRRKRTDFVLSLFFVECRQSLLDRVELYYIHYVVTFGCMFLVFFSKIRL